MNEDLSNDSLYSTAFVQAVEYCGSNKLFLGLGNPDAKILILGKEQAYNNVHLPNTRDFITEILQNRSLENERNIIGWKKNIAENYKPFWEEMPTNGANPVYSWGAQRNVANRKSSGIWNGGTSSTYLKYQKLYQFITGEHTKSGRIGFQKDFFISELSDIPTKYSYVNKALSEVRAESIAKRKMLFKKAYFKKFPVIIIAAGHYPRDYGFDMEEVFEVKFARQKFADKSWYNLHYSQCGERILIHTRQLSMDVTDNLLEKIASECHAFF